MIVLQQVTISAASGSSLCCM